MSIELGSVELLGAEAIGQPGQRRFRLFTRSIRGSAILWMEKEQLNTLSLALDRFLAHLTQGQVLRTEAQAGGWSTPGGMPPDFPTTPDSDFQVAQIRLGYDEDRSMFLLVAVPLEIIMEPGQEPQALVREDEAVSLLFTEQQAQILSRAITVIVSAGRPTCPLCGAPLDDGPHACVRQNGHREIVQVEETDEDENEEGL